MIFIQCFDAVVKSPNL